MKRNSLLIFVLLLSLFGTTVQAKQPVKRGFWEDLVLALLQGLVNHGMNQRVRADLQQAESLINSYDNYGAIRVLQGTQRFLSSSHDYGYRQLAQKIAGICSDIRLGHTDVAKRRIKYILRKLPVAAPPNPYPPSPPHPNPPYPNPPQQGDQAFYRSLATTLRNAQHYLQQHRPRLAKRALQRVDQALAPRYSNFDRQLRASVQRIMGQVEYNQISYALNGLLGVIRQVEDAANSGGYNPPYNPGPTYEEKQNRREWIRDIRDLIDTIQDGNIQMARRDMRTLIRDVRNDGRPSQFNRDLVRRLQYVAQQLNQGGYYPDTYAVNSKLREIQRHLRQSIGKDHGYGHHDPGYNNDHPYLDY
mgnify:CR=1 FL=1